MPAKAIILLLDKDTLNANDQALANILENVLMEEHLVNHLVSSQGRNKRWL